jgi:hypothetical protein
LREDCPVPCATVHFDGDDIAGKVGMAFAPATAATSISAATSAVSTTPATCGTATAEFTTAA